VGEVDARVAWRAGGEQAVNKCAGLPLENETVRSDIANVKKDRGRLTAKPWAKRTQQDSLSEATSMTVSA